MPPRRKTAHAVPVIAIPVAQNESTVAQALSQCLRGAGAFTAGDQIPPCAILWTDPERLWEGTLAELKSLMPELFAFGPYAPEERIGPAIYLRCVEARAVAPSAPDGQIPIFYLPGVSKQQLREVEECPAELQPLVELQFRGTVWAHPNGKDWTPLAFLSSEHGGLGLEVARDAATLEALQRALPHLLREKVGELRGQRLDADFCNRLLTPDLPSLLLRWMNDPAGTKAGRTGDEWTAFGHQCAEEYGFHPDQDGALRAAELLGNRSEEWAVVWKRFAEAPQRYPGVVTLLEQAEPVDRGQFVFDREPWPRMNDAAEQGLAEALRLLKEKRPDEAAARIRELEKAHGHRRAWVWAEIGRSQFALALEHLHRLAALTEKPLAAASVEELGERYAQAGWEVDAAALAALACCTGVEHEEPICTAVRTLYLPWLEASARNLQTLQKANPESLKPRLDPVEAGEGRAILFADGLRYDVAQGLAEQLQSHSLQVERSWDWVPFPGVTPTAKPYVSPVAHLLKGGGAEDEFAVTIAGTGQRLTQERFQILLADQGVQILEGLDTGDPEGKAWAEAGTLDKRGHNEGWKLARLVAQEVEDLASRVGRLLAAGWQEVLVVTDHGWLLLPDGFPKIELSRFLVEQRWGRCAAMKEAATTELPLLPWYWNSAVSIASPPGVGCFKAGLEYAHGGISLQELVVSRMKVRAEGTASQSRLSGIKWVGLRCRVTVQGAIPGLRVDLRARPADPASSKVEGSVPREVAADGTTSLPVSDPAEEGTAAVVVLLSPDGQVIHSLHTVIGESI